MHGKPVMKGVNPVVMNVITNRKPINNMFYKKYDPLYSAPYIGIL